MKTIILAAALSLAASTAFATCKSDSADKRLAGAALTSHMKKCESDAKAKCTADSKVKKLVGAALGSHMKKCVADAVGT
jgi:DNA-binding FrmR family transcriptional regulator